MKHPAFRSRGGAVLVATAATLVLMAPPASADLVVSGSSEGGDLRHQVRAFCDAVAGVIVDFNSATFVVEATAFSSTRDLHAVPTATGVRCKIINANTGQSYGSVGGSLPGPLAVAVGTITAPINQPLKVCTVGRAVFSDGHGAESQPADADC